MGDTEKQGAVSVVKEESAVHLARRAALLVIADAAAKGCAFVAAAVTARVFGEVDFGALNLAQAVAAYALVVGGPWLEIYAVKTTAQAPERLGSIANTVIRLRLALGAGAFVAVGFIAYLAPSFHAVLPLVLLYGLSIFTGALSLQWITQAMQKTHLMGLAVFAAQATYLLLVSIFVQLTDGTWTVPLALVIGELIAVIGLWRWSRRSVGRLAEPLSYRDSIAFLRRAAPIGVAQLLRAVALGSDLVVVGMLLTLADAGAYGAAYKFYLLGISGIGLYMIVWLPKIVRTAGAQSSHLMRHLIVSAIVVLTLGSPALIVGMLFAEDVLVWVFGSGFAAGSTSMRILLATLILYALTTHIRGALLAFEKQHIDAFLVGVSAAVHVLAKIALAGPLGIEGVALGAVAGEAMLLILTIWVYHRVVRSARGAALLRPKGIQ
jgi:O-antigen/teichoic acid export membrane protein